MPRLFIGIRLERFHVRLLPFNEAHDVNSGIAFERTADFIHLHLKRAEHRLARIAHTTNIVAIGRKREQITLLDREPVCRKSIGGLILLQEGIKRFVCFVLIHQVLRVC